MGLGSAALHSTTSGDSWVLPPSKPVIGRDGQVKKHAAGKTIFVGMVEFDDRDTLAMFWNAAVAALDRCDFCWRGGRPMSAEIYQAGPTKRLRATKAEMEARKAALYEIVAEQQPMVVRQVFYQVVVRDLMSNSQSTYDKVQQTLVDMRRAGDLPYGWLTDHSRSVYRVPSYATVADAMQATANSYRKALWVDVPVRLEIWVEKKALIGVLWPIVLEHDGALYPAGGFTSLSFANDAAEEIASYEKPTLIYHLGDYDPSGVLIGEKMKRNCEIGHRRPRFILFGWPSRRSRLSTGTCPDSRPSKVRTIVAGPATASNWTQLRRTTFANSCVKQSNNGCRVSNSKS